jgi:uncharacterized OB-fold protein
MSLLERDPIAPQKWFDEMPISSRYTFGVAGERFFRALKDEGKILGSHCPACDVRYVPARQFCERCMAELVEWFDAGRSGVVETFTLLYEDLDGRATDEPQIVAFIRIADGGLVHRLGEVDVEDLDIGMPVEAVLRPKQQRKGSILDIRHFRPIHV